MTEFTKLTRRDCHAATFAALATAMFSGIPCALPAVHAAEAESQSPGEVVKSAREISAAEFQEEVKNLILTKKELRISMGFPEDKEAALAAYEKRQASFEKSEVGEIVTCLKQLVVNLRLSNVPTDHQTLNKYLKEFELEEQHPKVLWDDKTLNEKIRSLTLACLGMEDKFAEAAWRKVQREYLSSVVLDHQVFSPFKEYAELKSGGNELAKHFTLYACRRMSMGGMVMPKSESPFIGVARKLLIEKFNSDSPVPGDELWKDILSVWCLSSKRFEIPSEVLGAIRLDPDKNKGLVIYLPRKSDTLMSQVREALVEDINIEAEPSIVKYFKDKGAILQMPAKL